MSVYLQDPRWSVDWVRLIHDLRAAGLSSQEISGRCFVAKSSLVAYASEEFRQRPQHATGERLIALWCEQLGRARDEVPAHQHPLSVSEILRASR